MLIRRTLLMLTVFVLCIPALQAQIFRLEELNTELIHLLNLQKTAVIVPRGILEEHGPYLPSYTDGYSIQAHTEEPARAIVARPGWSVVIHPQIPLENNPANYIGNRWAFPESFAVRIATVREVCMDLADDIGEQGFRWVSLAKTPSA